MTHCFAEIRPAGSYTSSASSRSRPTSSRFVTFEAISVRLHLGNEGLKSGNDVTPGQSCSLGVPSILRKCQDSLQIVIQTITYRKILKISSISESPGNKGLRVHISAKMQPTDHMSTPVEYCRPPRRISGARYHSVTTCK